MIKKIAIAGAALLFPFTGILFAAEDEDALFGDTESVVSVEKIKDSSISSNLDKSSTSLSGAINNRTTYNMSKKWVDGRTNARANSFLTYLQGDLYLDIRLTKGIKSFVNLSVQYSPQAQENTAKTFTYAEKVSSNTVVYKTNREYLTTSIIIKELFLDANIAKAVYFRVGKQVLQWGRGYFWQPSDLINISKKNFMDMTYNREGSFGLKMHVPFGTTANIYSFVDMTGITNVDQTAGAVKAEFLLGATEFAFSAWGKKHYLPVYSFDFSTRVFKKLDVWGELSLSYGDNQRRNRIATNILPFPPFSAVTYYAPYQVTGRWSPKFCIGCSTTVDIQIQDRLSLVAEFYYDENGWDRASVPFESLYNGTFSSGYFGKYYAAFFSSFSDFFSQDLTLTFNAIGNLSDGSFTLVPGLSWEPVYNFTVGLSLIGYTGKNWTEYNLAGTDLTALLTLGLTF